jgi:intermembrane space import and assembly protein 40
LIEASLARPKPKTVTTQSSSLAPSSETLSAAPPPSDAAAESQEDRVDEKADGIPSEDEDEESSGGAFDPVTGKINWDCPCLGGMAYGPCGMQFREAFSCFVYSEEEPKGIDCVEKFKAMQDCFRENPDVYGDGTHELVGIYIPQQTILLFIQKF